MHLFGAEIAAGELRRRLGHISQVGGVRLLTSDNGPSRGVRLLEFRTGTGFAFEIGVDRGFDIGRADYRGASLSPRRWMLAGTRDFTNARSSHNLIRTRSRSRSKMYWP